MNEPTLARVNIVAIFLITMAAFVYVFPRWADPNQNSRLDMVFAVVRDGTFQIDEYVSNTVDYAKVGDNYYSDKAPGAAFLGMPFFAGLNLLFEAPWVNAFTLRLAESSAFVDTFNDAGTGLSTTKVEFALTQIVLSMLVSAVPTALLCATLYLLATSLSRSAMAAIITALAYGLASPAFPYANAFYGHQLAAFLLFTAFALTYLAPARMGVGRLLLLGLLLGYSVVAEYPVLLAVGVLFVYLLFALWQRRQLTSVLWTVVSGSTIAALWMSYNNHVFGGPLELGYSHSELWVQQHGSGFMSLTTPSLETFLGLTISPYRGLFFLAPWLFLAVPGAILWWRRRPDASDRAALIVCLAIVGALLLFNSASIMWWGGFAVGPRYLLPMLPFLALPCSLALAAWGKHLGFRIITGALLLWSIVAVWSQTLAGQSFPPDAFLDPWSQYVIPAWLQGNLARNLGNLLGLRGWVGMLPLLMLLVVAGVTWWLVVRRIQSNASKSPSLSNPHALAGQRETAN